MLHCVRRQRPYKLIDAAEVSPGRAAQLATEFIEQCGVSVLNVAGPRASQESKAHSYAFHAVRQLLELGTGNTGAA